ncbi:MAG TPA: efflux transporter outer membrane subunit, partial [Candidatus Polarisedimenticolaceae bacterium]|nr:efflux transporter outer membrane subunit [Candidatus Polarisedimenticolaceae bacterium]
MTNLRLKSMIAVSLILSACSLAPQYQRPQIAMPAGWTDVAGVGTTDQPATVPFWQELGSEELNNVMKIALAQNLDLEAALHRIDQARAQTKIAGSSLFPQIEASGGASRSFQDPRNVSIARGTGSISYEADLWGRNRSNRAAANYRAEATAFDHDALQLVVTSDTADFYSQVLSLNERIRIAESNLKNAEEVLRIIEARYKAGSVSGLEVSQQRVAVNSFRASLASLNQQRSTTLNALAILLGQAPQNLLAPRETLDSLKVPDVNLTPPATLLTARPDIERAEASLRAANADIGAARAAFFPSLNFGLDASIAAGFGGPAATVVSLASSAIAPIFTGGRLTGNLEDITARQKELAAQYQKTVLIAFQEVEDALAAYKNSNEQSVIAHESVKESQAAYDIAKARFDAGAIDYLNLLV